MRAPLRHIKGYLGFLEDAIDNDDKATMRKELEYIYKSANNLDVLIDDIIMYSRVTSERKDISKVCLNDVVDSVIGTLSPIIDKNKVQVSRDDLPELNGDKNLLTHLFQNLIGNACKYTDKEIPKIKISYENTDAHCRISVEDNGIGFNLTYSEKMFDPFQRLVTKDDFEGTGIGLSICKTVVDQHNGKIEVTSALGVGSCFTVSLPRT